MKKIITLLMCALLTAGAAMAQKKFTFGPKIGVDYTHFWGKDTHSFWGFKGLVNYQAGMFVEYRFSNKISIAPEVVFAAQGAKFDYDYDVLDDNNVVIDNIEGTMTYHLNYIYVPVMFKYYVVPSLSIDFGPQLGLNVYSKKTSNEPRGDGKETLDNGDETRLLDMGLGLGLTYNISSDVFVQGRYSLGFSKVFDWGESKNGNAQIAIGYRF